MSAREGYRTLTLGILNATTEVYPTTILDNALRWALHEYSRAHPLVREYELESTGYKVIELPNDFKAVKIIGVDLWNADPDAIVPVTYYASFRDETWHIETVSATYAAGQVLTVTYTTLHTIDGLDAAAGTSVPDQDEHMIACGAAARAIYIRNAFTTLID